MIAVILSSLVGKEWHDRLAKNTSSHPAAAASTAQQVLAQLWRRFLHYWIYRNSLLWPNQSDAQTLWAIQQTCLTQWVVCVPNEVHRSTWSYGPLSCLIQTASWPRPVSQDCLCGCSQVCMSSLRTSYWCPYVKCKEHLKRFCDQEIPWMPINRPYPFNGQRFWKSQQNGGGIWYLCLETCLCSWSIISNP